MTRELLLRIATAAFAVVSGYGVVHAHDQRITIDTTPNGAVIRSVVPIDGPTPTPTPGPTATPRPTATAPNPEPTKIICNADFSRLLRTPLGSGYGGEWLLKEGEILVGCVYTDEAIPEGVVPSRISFHTYDLSDRDCGNTALSVQQLCGKRETKPESGLPATGQSNGGIHFTKRVGRTEDPERVCRGLYVFSVRGGPWIAPECRRALLSWGWQ